MKGFNVWRLKAVMIMALLYLMPDTFAQDNRDVVRLNVIIARRDDGSQARTTRDRVNIMLRKLNEEYSNANIRFDLCGVNFFDETDYWEDFRPRESDELELIEALDDLYKEHVLNVFITGMRGHGHANWPEDFMDLVEIEGEGGFDTTSTPIHEIGHYFGLYHTYDNRWGSELVNGDNRNRNTTGDLVSDTPASPGGVERDMDSDDCSYQGNATDSHNDRYAPDGRNYMEDAPTTCRDRFSDIQRSRIRSTLLLDRYYLIYNDCNPPADSLTLHGDDDEILVINDFPHREHFDRAGADTWMTDVDLDYGWSWGPSTPTSSTGASRAQDGYYFKYISVDGRGEATYGLVSPIYDLDGKDTAFIEFYYNMYGSRTHMGDLIVEVTTDNAKNWTELFKRSGRQHTNGDTWTLAQIDLKDYVGHSIQLRIKGTSTGDTDEGDISIDNIIVNASVKDNNDDDDGDNNDDDGDNNDDDGDNNDDNGNSNKSYTFKINAKSDDAEEFVDSDYKKYGKVSIKSSDLELTDESSKTSHRQIIGMRFTNINIPQGAKIVSAYIQFTVDDTNDGACDLTIQAEDIDSSATFAKVDNNISNRAKTDASVNWKPDSWDNEGDAGDAQKTPDIKDIIQEVVNRDGFKSGNPITILITGSGERDAVSYNGSADHAPVLHITIEQAENDGDAKSAKIKTNINVKENLGNNEIILYPNPVKYTLHIKGMQSASTVTIISMKGVVIKTVKVNKNSNQINVSDLKNGMYLLRYLDGDSYKVERFIKE